MSTKTIASSLCLIMACLAVVESCKKDDAPPAGAVVLTDQEILDRVLNLPPTPLNYAHPDLPPYIRDHLGLIQIDNTPGDNPVTDAGATLGRVLFYDKALSATHTVACASCHKQESGFADPVRFSTGFAGVKTTRNAMSLANAKYFEKGTFLWDLRAASLEEQTLLPIQHPVEMGLTLDELGKRVAEKDYYRILFRRAFGDETVTSQRVSLALAQFVRSMVSFQSKFDEGMQAAPVPNPNETFSNFSQEENNGMRLFSINCGACHISTVHISSAARNNGLDLVYADNGVGAITHDPSDNGKFKTPSMRNIAVTAPYMHDGRFATLAEVVTHYNEGIQQHPALDGSLREPGTNGKPLRLHLTQKQQDDIVAFLQTLTDNHFLTDVKYSDPFRH